jgi:hypothetical protein
MGRFEVVSGAFEASYKAVPYIEGLALLPLKATAAVYAYARRVVADSTEVILPKASTELARELAGEHELQKAEHVVKNIEIGENAKVSDIVFSARAELAEIVLESHDAKTVPREVTDKIIEMATEVEVDLEFEPYLDDETQDEFKKVVTEHTAKPPKKREVVSDMSQYRENKL